MKVGIIIPCYNEENRLNSQAFLNCLKTYSSFDLCFVNDGSADNTIKVLKEIQTHYPKRVTVLDMKQNKGKASAIRAGARYYYGIEAIQYVGYLDADLSTDFRDFNDLVKRLKQNRKLIMTFGSRNSENQDNIERNAFRKFFSNIVKSLVYFILKLPIKDTQCGAKVFRKKFIPVMFNTNFKSRWLFDIEMFIRLNKHFSDRDLMQHIEEIPLKRWVHVDDSKLGLKDSLEIPYRLAQIWFSYKIAA